MTARIAAASVLHAHVNTAKPASTARTWLVASAHDNFAATNAASSTAIRLTTGDHSRGRESDHALLADDDPVDVLLDAAEELSRSSRVQLW